MWYKYGYEVQGTGFEIAYIWTAKDIHLILVKERAHSYESHTDDGQKMIFCTWLAEFLLKGYL